MTAMANHTPRSPSGPASRGTAMQQRPLSSSVAVMTFLAHLGCSRVLGLRASGGACLAWRDARKGCSYDAALGWQEEEPVRGRWLALAGRQTLNR